MIEAVKIFACVIGTAYLAIIINYYVTVWQSREIKETDEGPHLYLTKEIKDGR